MMDASQRLGRLPRPTRARAERPSTSGVVGNERLTALVGAVLLVVLAAEGITILQLRALFSAHVFLGVLLAGPIAVKLASTGYRFVSYYRGRPAYRRKGPPQPLLRLLAPALVVSTLTVVGSGFALLAVNPAHPGVMLFVHKASFVIWFGLTALHVLVYLWRIPGLIAADWPRRRPLAGGARSRLLLTSAGLLAGTLAAVLLLPTAHAWSIWLAGHHSGR